jgi:hypothetical protein
MSTIVPPSDCCNGPREIYRHVYFPGVGSLTQNVRSPRGTLAPPLRNERGATATRGRITLGACLMTPCSFFTSGISSRGIVSRDVV